MNVAMVMITLASVGGRALFVLSASSGFSGKGSASSIPTIIGTIENVTAAEGKTAKFTCTVKNLNKYHVVWFHLDRNMLLTIHTKIVTRIKRFRVIPDDGERWTLEIRDVTQSDRGAYACQVNTEPQLRRIAYLNVVVSPEIDDSGSSPSSVVVKENGNVTMVCQAVGNPQPSITWVREDQGPITLTHRHKVPKFAGPTLELRKVSRSDMGAYLCIASNGYPPSVSKRTELFVEFSPIVIIPNQLMAAPRGTSVSLECVTEAFPRAVIYWKYRGNMVMSTHKYHITEEHDTYRTTVILTIHELMKSDFGTYLCNSRNSFGENVGIVELNELTIPEVKKRPKDQRSKEESKCRTSLRMFPPVSHRHSRYTSGESVEMSDTFVRGTKDAVGGVSQSQSHVLVDLGMRHSANITFRRESNPKDGLNPREGNPLPGTELGQQHPPSNSLDGLFSDVSAGSGITRVTQKIMELLVIATRVNYLWR